MKRFIRMALTIFPRPWLIRFSYVFMRLVAVFYRGNAVECPVCKGRFSKFLPYGYNKVRENVLCPRCLSLERHRLLWLYLRERTGIFTGNYSLLHIAPEQCFYKRFRKMGNLTYVTADLESPLADIKLDVQAMPFKDDEFDIVICNHVLEHVPDDRKALREIYRVLKKGGFALMQVPTNFSLEKTYEDPSITDPSDREKHFRQKDHYRLYGRDYPERFREAGFIIREENYLLVLDVEKKQRFRLPEMDYMYGYYKG